MPVEPVRIAQRLERLIRWYRPNGENGFAQPIDEPPLRGELFNVDQLARHAQELAAAQQLAAGRAPDRLIARLDENERVLTHTYDLVTAAVKKNRRVAPAAEWLLDNFYVIEEQIRTSRRHLPRRYSRELPRLANGSAAGFPRVYGIALEMISHMDGAVDSASLNGFLRSYQSVKPLTMGELWAVPIMLRLALIENLRRVALQLAAGRRDRDLAYEWAQRMIAVVEQNPTDLILVLADMARADPRLSSAFLAELTRHLHGQSPHFAFAQSWLEHRLSEQGSKISQLVQMESQIQAADQVSIGNSITSLRFLGSTDWREFVESQSVVERELCGDPAGAHAGMDFGTRDRYRHAVEEIARASRHSELDVAQMATGLARAAPANRSDRRKAHVGYYLIDGGRPALERRADMRRPLRLIASKVLRRYPLAFYLTGVVIVIAAVLTPLLAWTAHQGLHSWRLAIAAILALLCVSQLAVGFMNWLVTEFVGPRPLPRMDFRDGIPAAHRTMVVVPAMLSTTGAIDDLFEALEIRYLANRDKNLHFALLTDLNDAPQEVMPGDEELIQHARSAVESLERKYAQDRSNIFFLFHRPRRWNQQEGVWMGHERKRGKLAEINAVFCGGPTDRFAFVIGDPAVLPDVRYVITLDTDTQLPRESAREMVGAMTHILNRPLFDNRRNRVTRGYGILQPRVGVTLASASRSLFARLFAADSGLDPYTRVVSDVYQDLFGEGSFIGKGIYDVAAFERACSNFPENAILSHDLLESAYARSGFLSDVELYEEQPARFAVDVSRRCRWIRGDWQIASWLLPRVPGPQGRWIRNPISALSRWKIADNLRRSLVPPGMLLLLVSGLVTSSSLAIGAALVVVGTMLAVPILAAIAGAFRKPAGLPLGMHLRCSAESLSAQGAQSLFTLEFLPHEAYVSIDAIGRTLVRVLWTRRRLLEWQTSSDAAKAARRDLPGNFRWLLGEPVFAFVVFLLLIVFRPEHLIASAPLLVAWLLAPVVAWWLSASLTPRPAQLSQDQNVFLRALARRTWRYFETFVSQEENWLPPDNFQEHPKSIVASRTSPTNISMALLANLAAYDFGYCSAGQMLERTRNTLATMDRMERFRGHFYNWYDTRSLKPLPPSYISTVDSGNLAGHLLVLRAGLLEMPGEKIISARAFEGIRDTLGVLLETARGQARGTPLDREPRFSAASIKKLERIAKDLGDPPRTLSASFMLLQNLANAATEIVDVAGEDAEFNWWARALQRATSDHRDEVARLTPWLHLPPAKLDDQPRGLRDALRRLDEVPTLQQVAAMQQSMLPLIDAIVPDPAKLDLLSQLRGAVIDASVHAAQRLRNLENAATRCAEFAEMDFSFLLDKSRDLFSIGYNVGDHRLDAGYYDLLASEARLISFVTIAQGQVGQDHWFALGRMLTASAAAPALLSWSGSMFEYLMPLLVMPTYPDTLLDRTYHSVVRRQIDYGRQREVSWGISESGYNATDVNLNYQYRAFGVPGLGLKRGLAEDLVIAPYASVLALMVAPEAACRNLQRLAADARLGVYGFYEAIDYTPARLPRGQSSVTVRSFMAHHQGMSLLALAYLLLGQPMQRRFSSDPMLRATDLLLQERVSRASAPVFPHALEASSPHAISAEAEGTTRVFTDPNTSTPEVHLLSNGRYHVMVTNAGGGYSRWRDLDVTRWREDPTRDCWGTFCYLRDLDSGNFWSVAHQPTLKPAKGYEAIFSQARAEFRRQDEEIETHTEISVSPEDDIELRRVTITNRSSETRTIEVTSYAEVVLASAGQDLTHPAFSNLFVQTDLVRHREAIFCTRRPRSESEHPAWMIHLMTVQGSAVGKTLFETDRMKFIGRGRSLAEPAVMIPGGQLSNSEGAVLDPIVSIRRTVRLKPNESARVDIFSGVAETRNAAAALIEKYHDPRLADRVFELAWTHSQVELRHLNASEAEAQVYGRLAGSVIYTTARRRASPSTLARNRRGQSGLWGYGISGDLPIVLLRIRDRSKLDLVRQTIQAHAYWLMKGLVVDLVIWNEDDSTYRQEFHDTIMGIVASSTHAGLVDKPGGIFVRRGDQIPEEDQVLLQTAARVVLQDDAGSLREQVERRGRIDPPIPAFKAPRYRSEAPLGKDSPRRDLAYFNGLGGFTRDGREYVTILPPGINTPAPWVNVIANPEFGTVVSESGSVYTWAENSHEFRLTPWHNDPVGGGGGECFYVRDEESGRRWSPAPQPVRGAMPYVVRHGFGYSVFEYAEDGIVAELTIYVATDAPVKFARLKLTNRSSRARRLSVTGFWELVLGELRHKSLLHVTSEIDPLTNAILARNAYNTDFPDRIVFVDCSETARSITCDRREFLGRNGTPADPAALRRTHLSGRVGAGLDPCAAIQVLMQLEEGQEKEVVFTIGAGRSEQEVRKTIQRSRGLANARRELEAVWQFWSRTLGVVHVETPDPSVNFLANGWLEYQTLSCRMWARTGFYQSGGAFGFRDQLQDSMALVHAAPEILRQHLLRAAARQFREGDVQHWWHAHSGRGVRTHFSDDYLWLPYAVSHYVASTGDTGVLEERVAFLDGRPVRPEEDAYYDLPQASSDIGTLYEHCVRAITHGLRFGAHGLPLIGCGDWNDGMNLVGEKGQGESVWLAFFLGDVLSQFARLARRRGDDAFADKCTSEAQALHQRTEASGWDGEWYRRAYFDNGEPLGSAQNPECQIDSLPQSWAILSAAGDPARAAQAMQSVEQRLVRRDARLIQLFDPPFDKSTLNPGYIKGYPPGVRENGGQYTHAAIWTVMAFAAMDDSQRAWDLLSMINPINHGASREQVQIYRVEPYVVAADVYAAAGHTGRGGWTWYTGSAGWMYRLITESLLGLHLEIDKLRLTPRLPPGWSEFKLHYRYRETFYHITIHTTGTGKHVQRLLLDGAEIPDGAIPLADDRKPHNVELELA